MSFRERAKEGIRSESSSAVDQSKKYPHFQGTGEYINFDKWYPKSANWSVETEVNVTGDDTGAIVGNHNVDGTACEDIRIRNNTGLFTYSHYPHSGSVSVPRKNGRDTVLRVDITAETYTLSDNFGNKMSNPLTTYPINNPPQFGTIGKRSTATLGNAIVKYVKLIDHTTLQGGRFLFGAQGIEAMIDRITFRGDFDIEFEAYFIDTPVSDGWRMFGDSTVNSSFLKIFNSTGASGAENIFRVTINSQSFDCPTRLDYLTRSEDNIVKFRVVREYQTLKYYVNGVFLGQRTDANIQGDFTFDRIQGSWATNNEMVDNAFSNLKMLNKQTAELYLFKNKDDVGNVLRNSSTESVYGDEFIDKMASRNAAEGGGVVLSDRVIEIYPSGLGRFYFTGQGAKGNTYEYKFRVLQGEVNFTDLSDNPSNGPAYGKGTHTSVRQWETNRGNDLWIDFKNSPGATENLIVEILSIRPIYAKATTTQGTWRNRSQVRLLSDSEADAMRRYVPQINRFIDLSVTPEIVPPKSSMQNARVVDGSFAVGESLHARIPEIFVDFDFEIELEMIRKDSPLNDNQFILGGTGAGEYYNDFRINVNNSDAAANPNRIAFVHNGLYPGWNDVLAGVSQDEHIKLKFDRNNMWLNDVNMGVPSGSNSDPRIDSNFPIAKIGIGSQTNLSGTHTALANIIIRNKDTGHVWHYPNLNDKDNVLRNASTVDVFGDELWTWDNITTDNADWVIDKENKLAIVNNIDSDYPRVLTSGIAEEGKVYRVQYTQTNIQNSGLQVIVGTNNGGNWWDWEANDHTRVRYLRATGTDTRIGFKADPGAKYVLSNISVREVIARATAEDDVELWDDNNTRVNQQPIADFRVGDTIGDWTNMGNGVYVLNGSVGSTLEPPTRLNDASKHYIARFKATGVWGGGIRVGSGSGPVVTEDGYYEVVGSIDSMGYFCFKRQSGLSGGTISNISVKPCTHGVWFKYNTYQLKGSINALRKYKAPQARTFKDAVGNSVVVKGKRKGSDLTLTGFSVNSFKKRK